MFQGIALILLRSFILCVCVWWCTVILGSFQPWTKPMQRSTRSTVSWQGIWRRTLARLSTQKWPRTVVCIFYLCTCCVLIQLWRCHTRCAYSSVVLLVLFQVLFTYSCCAFVKKTCLLKFSARHSILINVLSAVGDAPGEGDAEGTGASGGGCKEQSTPTDETRRGFLLSYVGLACLFSCLRFVYLYHISFFTSVNFTCAQYFLCGGCIYTCLAAGGCFFYMCDPFSCELRLRRSKIGRRMSQKTQ